MDDIKDTLFVSDLDGTLLGPDSRISCASASMLDEAISAGANFTVATARTPATVSGLLSGVDIRLPAVVMTGSALWNRETDTFSEMKFLPPDTVGELVEIYRDSRLPAFIYTLEDNRLLIYHIGELSALERRFMEERADSPYKRFFVPADGESRLPARIANALLFYSMRPTAEVAPVNDILKRREDCNPVYYHDMFGPEIGIMEVFSRGADKAGAVRELAASRGFRRIVAFGDNLNDLPMLRAADVAVAVENAVDEVKAAADVIVGPNSADSVAEYILRHTRG